MIRYQSGFGNYFETEATPNILPLGQNSPQKLNSGLYAELLSGSAFTMPRNANHRSWLYKILPSVKHSDFELQKEFFNTEDFVITPNQLRAMPRTNCKGNFIESLQILAKNNGSNIWSYFCDSNMENQYFYNSDGEFLIVPQLGGLNIFTEFGVIAIQPKEIAVIPRGVKFKVDLVDKTARGYICENLGALFQLPDLGPIGSNGLAAPRDFLYPQAHYEKDIGKCILFNKFKNHLFRCVLEDSPLNTVAWHGNYAPYKYDLSRFNTMNSVSFDHADPSIFTVLTSPTNTLGMANVDFVIFPPRWSVSEHSFRPPYYHRNIMSEFMGLIEGVYDAKPTGFQPGGYSLHNCMSPHGPDANTYKLASTKKLVPEKLENTLAFMFESSMIYDPHKDQINSSERDRNYIGCWNDLESEFVD